MALRHQLAVLQRSSKRPRLRQCDRILGLSRLWANWRSCLVIVKPQTVFKTQVAHVEFTSAPPDDVFTKAKDSTL